MKRPDMSAWFRSRIDWHTHGMLSGGHVRLPGDVKHVYGDVTSPLLTVVMNDGTRWEWAGGQYSSRKRHGCYPPLMPKPVSKPVPSR